MKNCRERQANLKAYVDGEAPVPDRLAMWWHLLRCVTCREARMAMTEISRRLSSVEREALDPALRARILSSVTYTDKREAPALRPKYRGVGYPILLLGGATAAGLLVIVLMNAPRGAYAPNAVSENTSAPMVTPPAGSRLDSAVSAPTDTAATGAAGKSEQQSQFKMKSPAQPAPQGRTRAADDARSTFDSPTKSQSEYARPAPVPPAPVHAPAALKETQDYRITDRASDKKQFLNGFAPVQRPGFGGTRKGDAEPGAAYGGRAESARKLRSASPSHAKSGVLRPVRAHVKPQTPSSASKSAK